MFRQIFLGGALALLVTVSAPAHAERYIMNNVAISKLCGYGGFGRAVVDEVGCGLLKTVYTPLPRSAMRLLGDKLWEVRHVARQPQDSAEAEKLFTALQDELDSQQEVQRSIQIGPVRAGPNNAGAVIETAVVSLLQGCADNPRQRCEVLSSNGVATMRRILALLQRVYPEHGKVWLRLLDVLD